MHDHSRWVASLVGAGLVLVGAAPASAQLTFVGTFKNLTHEQTDATTVTPNGGFFNAGASFTNPGDFAAATLTYPGPGSPAGLPLVDPTDFGISPGFPTQAAMDAAYPFGSYVFNFSGGSMGLPPKRLATQWTLIRPTFRNWLRRASMRFWASARA